MRFTAVLAAAALLSGCKGAPAPSPPPPAAPIEVEVDGTLHAVRCGDVTAEWLGTAPDAPAPKAFGVESLRFRFKDGAVRPFKPSGALEFSDWSFEVFSPDCAYAVLLVERFGPYAAVKTPALAAFLEGGGGAVELKHGDAAARVHSALRFVSPTEVEFQAACCGGVDVVRAAVDGAGKRAVVFSAPEAPRGLRHTERGYEVAP